MSGAAARRFRLAKRGELREGYAADVTVFDWGTVSESENEAGDATPVGIEQVFVNGRQIFDRGEISHAPGAGRVLGT